MKIKRYFVRFFDCLHKAIACLTGLQLIAVSAVFFSAQALAVTMTMQVVDGVGGHIAAFPETTECFQTCTAQTPANAVISLFAIPEPGYRFQGWRGGCADTIGPLCTFDTVENANVVAHFVKAEDLPKMTKALLLLHDPAFKNTVWNSFVSQYFAESCPTIYGGVILGTDSVNPDNQVYCYRIAFGYYDMLEQKNQENGLKSGNAIVNEQLSNEVQAAVLGILNRHPQLSLTMVSHDRATLAAQAFFTTETAKTNEIIGWVALHSNFNKDDVVLQYEKPDILVIAEPKHVRLIDKVLTQIADSWWIRRW